MPRDPSRRAARRAGRVRHDPRHASRASPRRVRAAARRRDRVRRVRRRRARRHGGLQAAGRREGALQGRPWGMSVAPAARRPGVGAALLDAALAAAARTAGQVALAAVDGRGAARAFCERHGFVAYGVEPRALDAANGCADALPMVKFPPLAPPRA
ncbi:GNAT family N-acetyltransferase [Burkholderia pseudomallei]|nr:GNAT family N-acetyltransferase [Burkholderia pseudomallei]